MIKKQTQVEFLEFCAPLNSRDLGVGSQVTSIG